MPVNFATDLLLRRTCGIVISIALVATLYFARDVFLPLTLSVLLTFLLSSPVKRLEKRGVNRIAAVTGIMLIVCCAMILCGLVISRQVISLANDLPNYKQNISEKVKYVKGWAGDNLRQIETLMDYPEKSGKQGLEHENKDVSRDETDNKLTHSTGNEPVPVTITNNTIQPLEIARNLLGPILSPLSLIGLVLLFTVFMLLEKDDLRNRFVVLLGSQRLYGTTQMLDEAGSKVSRYLRMQLLLNTIYGTAVAIGLSVIGVPNAILWGFLGCILRFLPYVGPLLAMVFPIVLSLAVFEGWMQPIFVISMYVVIELITNNILEPLMYGSSTGLSVMGILVSALFWTWLWGIPGLILATPITVCITVLGRHFPQWRFMNILLSDEPPLPPATLVYQRLLARDQEQVFETIESFKKENSVQQLCDQVLLPVMHMGEMDRRFGNMSDDEKSLLNNDLHYLIDELFENSETNEKQDSSANTSARILCIPAKDEGDELACLLLSHLLRTQGYKVDVMSRNTLVGETVQELQTKEYDLAIISVLSTDAVLHSRYLWKKIHTAKPKMPVLMGYWLQEHITERMKNQTEDQSLNKFVIHIEEALNWIKQEVPGWIDIRNLREKDATNQNHLAEV